MEQERACTDAILHLERKKKRVDDIVGAIDTSIETLAQLRTSHHLVSTKTDGLHRETQTLLETQKQTSHMVTALRTQVAFFDDFEQIERQFASASVKVTAPLCSPILANV